MKHKSATYEYSIQKSSPDFHYMIEREFKANFYAKVSKWDKKYVLKAG